MIIYSFKFYMILYGKASQIWFMTSLNKSTHLLILDNRIRSSSSSPCISVVLKPSRAIAPTETKICHHHPRYTLMVNTNIIA